MGWIKRVLENLVLKVGIKPVFSLVISFLRSKTDKTVTKFDDYGVDFLEKVKDSNQYDLINIITIALEQLRILSQQTTNEYDDKVVNMLLRLVKSGKITLEQAYDELVVEIDNYAKSTATPYDDFIPIGLKEIKKEIFK